MVLIIKQSLHCDLLHDLFVKCFFMIYSTRVAAFMTFFTKPLQLQYFPKKTSIKTFISKSATTIFQLPEIVKH